MKTTMIEQSFYS